MWHCVWQVSVLMYFFTPYLLPRQTSLVLTMCSSLTDQESHNKQLLLFYKHSCIWSLAGSIFPLFLFMEQYHRRGETDTQKLWPILKMMEHSVQCSSSLIETSYLFFAVENGCKIKAGVVLAKLFLCRETANGSREVQEKKRKKIRTAEPSVTQPQSKQSTEEDKAVKNGHLYWA